MRTKRAVFNLLSNLILQVVTAMIGFILPRMLITTYGSSINGLVSSIKHFLSYLKIVEAGVGNASIVALYKPLSNNDRNSINGILSATNFFYRRSGYIFGVLVFLLAIIYPAIVKNEINPTLAFYLVLILGISGIWDYLLIGKYRVLLTADQKSYVLFRIQTALMIISSTLSVILVYLKLPILSVICVSTIILLFNVVFISLYIKKYYPFFNIKVNPDKKAIKGKWDALIHQIAGLVVFNSPLVIITIFTGLSEVSVYSIYNMVFSAVTLLISAFSSGMLAAFGDLIARGDKRYIRKHYNNFEYIFYAVVAFSYTCTALLIYPFIKIYTAGFDDANYIRPMLATLFVIVGVANAIRIPSSTIVNSAGHFSQTKYRAIIEAIITLVASFIFVQFFGTEGVLLGVLCSYVYRTTDLIIYSSIKILNRSSWHTLNKLIRNLILSILSASPFIFLIKINIDNLFVWFLYAGLIALWILLIILLGNFILEPKTMRDIFGQLKSSIRAKKI
jgi:O-antigen/teichoic acid export membrane protein